MLSIPYRATSLVVQMQPIKVDDLKKCAKRWGGVFIYNLITNFIDGVATQYYSSKYVEL